MTFADRIRLPFSFDVAKLTADLDRLAGDVWIEHFVKQHYEGDWSVLPLRVPVGETHPIRQIYPNPGATEFVEGPLLARLPYIREALATFQCPLRIVRLMKLTAGSVIKEHSDHDLSFEQGAVRLHVPIVTNDAVEFLLNGTPVPLTPGSVWYLRLSDRHSVANRGATDRIHLVVDCLPNEWLAAQLGQVPSGAN